MLTTPFHPMVRSTMHEVVRANPDYDSQGHMGRGAARWSVDSTMMIRDRPATRRKPIPATMSPPLTVAVPAVAQEHRLL